MMDKSQLAKKILLNVRYLCMTKYPYLAPSLQALTIWGELPKSAPVQTVAVTKDWIVLYNSDFVLEMAGATNFSDIRSENLTNLEFILLHELHHVLRNHHVRTIALGDVVEEIALVASDCEVNSSLCSIFSHHPDGIVRPKDFSLPDFHSYEFYYEQLLNHLRLQRGRRGRGQGQQQEGSGQQQGETLHEGRCRCGGGSGAGKTPAWEKEVSLPPGVSEARAEAIRQETARRILEWEQKRQGSVPSDLIRWAEQYLQPRVDWRSLLRVAVVTATASHRLGKADYTYRRPSRRTDWYSQPVIVRPGMVEPEASVAVVIDTSGSISDNELAQALSELRAILQEVGSVVVISCDAAVNLVTKIFSVEELRGRVKGGGGTDMREGVKAALSLKPTPNVVIVLTDGYTDFPSPSEIPSSVEVVWGILGRDVMDVLRMVGEVKQVGFRNVVPIPVKGGD